MALRICLINPPIILKKQFGKPSIFQPLGLLYIAGVLEKNHFVEIIDAPIEDWKNLKEFQDVYFLGLNFKELKKRIERTKPDIVGITIPFSINLKSALRVASIAKQVNKNIIVVVGGPHVTARPSETLSFPHIDFVVVGEGEITIQELVSKIEKKSFGEFSQVQGIGYKKNNQLIFTPRRPLIQNIDILPFPARHLVPIEEYFKASVLNKEARNNYIYSNRWTSIFTSRGCPYNCSFCSINLTMGRIFRKRSPENVLKEIKQVYTKYKIRHINFEDDNLTLDKQRAARIFDLITENKLNITWSAPNGLRADFIDEELVQKMKNSGCQRVFVAPESGVQRVVSKIIGKNLDLKKVQQAVVLFKKYKITVDGSFVIGLIRETKIDILKTIIFALKLKKLGMTTAGFHIATPYYGTRLYREAIQKGYLREDLDPSLFSTQEPLISTPEWSSSQLKHLRKFAEWLVNYNWRQKIVSILPPWIVSLIREIRNKLKLTKINKVN